MLRDGYPAQVACASCVIAGEVPTTKRSRRSPMPMRSQTRAGSPSYATGEERHEDHPPTAPARLGA
jgi:hypothetical protein